ncbi:hypothetical protein [endosymbiont GvMRE of Glomus versiforme]|uniref:hypothetical protein n=1 Tax=endosymbiont GvMRE of Glomus versiforme TaxID=2039283 RepID=UPI000ED74D34|nr:hypothetical protein [endosymbiont GvMRE of Glomus versiforme]RHZ37708.1 hypothetical protein GvMRE_I1g526 [endosymbiont GvMRE of Glomus versiforme]
MPLTTKKALEKLSQRKKQREQEKVNSQELQTKFSQINTDYNELKKAYEGMVTNLTKLQEKLTLSEEEKDKIQQQLEETNTVLNKSNPKMVTIGTQTEISSHEIEQMQKKMAQLVILGRTRREKNDQIKGLQRRIKASEQQVDRLCRDKAHLENKGQELNQKINELEDELKKEKLSTGDLEIKIKNLEEALEQEKNEYEKSLEIKQKEWDILNKNLDEIARQAKEQHLHLTNLEQIKNRLEKELREKEEQYQLIIEKLEHQLKQTGEDLNLEINSLNSARKKESVDFQKQITKIQQDLEKERQQGKETNKQTQESLKKIEKLKKELEEKERDNTFLTSSLNISENRKKELEVQEKQAREQIQTAKREIANLEQSKLTEKERELSNFIDQLWSKYLKTESDYNNPSQLKKAEEEINEKYQEIITTKQTKYEKGARTEFYPDYPFLFSYIEKLKKQISHHYQHRKETDKINQQINGLKAQQQEKIRTISLTSSKLEKKLKECQKQVKDNKDLNQKEQIALKAEIAKLNQLREELEKKTKKKKEKIKKLEENIEKQKQEIEKTNAWIEAERRLFLNLDFSPKSLTELKKLLEKKTEWKEKTETSKYDQAEFKQWLEENPSKKSQIDWNGVLKIRREWLDDLLQDHGHLNTVKQTIEEWKSQVDKQNDHQIELLKDRIRYLETTGKTEETKPVNIEELKANVKQLKKFIEELGENPSEEQQELREEIRNNLTELLSESERIKDLIKQEKLKFLELRNEKEKWEVMKEKKGKKRGWEEFYYWLKDGFNKNEDINKRTRPFRVTTPSEFLWSLQVINPLSAYLFGCLKKTVGDIDLTISHSLTLSNYLFGGVDIFVIGRNPEGQWKIGKRDNKINELKFLPYEEDKPFQDMITPIIETWTAAIKKADSERARKQYNNADSSFFDLLLENWRSSIPLIEKFSQELTAEEETLLTKTNNFLDKINEFLNQEPENRDQEALWQEFQQLKNYFSQNQNNFPNIRTYFSQALENNGSLSQILNKIIDLNQQKEKISKEIKEQEEELKDYTNALDKLNDLEKEFLDLTKKLSEIIHKNQKFSEEEIEKIKEFKGEDKMPILWKYAEKYEKAMLSWNNKWEQQNNKEENYQQEIDELRNRILGENNENLSQL